jgi:Flp pilus assembly pilin Flp
MRKTGQFLAKIWNDESGISSVEYALLLAFVAAGIILGAEVLSNAVQTEMEDAAACITGSIPSTSC